MQTFHPHKNGHMCFCFQDILSPVIMVCRCTLFSIKWTLHSLLLMEHISPRVDPCPSWQQGDFMYLIAHHAEGQLNPVCLLPFLPENLCLTSRVLFPNTSLKTPNYFPIFLSCTGDFTHVFVNYCTIVIKYNITVHSIPEKLNMSWSRLCQTCSE